MLACCTLMDLVAVKAPAAGVRGAIMMRARV
jgi:hypothetical protein